MLTEPQGPSYARVLKVQDPAQKSSMPTPSHLVEETPIVDKAPAPEDWQMQEPVKQKESEWEQVPAKPKSISIRTASSSYSQSSPSASVSKVVPGLGTQSDKKSRQNLARAQAAKEAKQQAEVERQARLNEHRRARAAEEEKLRNRERQSKGIKSQSNLSGGMRAAVSSDGALIWE